jgi:hypothetical protein
MTGTPVRRNSSDRLCQALGCANPVAPPLFCPSGEGGLKAVLELLHLFLEEPRWEESAMERAKQMYLSHYRSRLKGLERATADRVMDAMMGDDRFSRPPLLSFSSGGQKGSG